MGIGLTRRELLRAKRSRPMPMRPPGALPEADFLTKCDGCAACLTACPEAILRLHDGKVRIDFSLGSGECTFCGECLSACPTGALSQEGTRPWSWVAAIGADCLSLNGVSCRTCSDVCEPGAIRFQRLPGCRDIPLIADDECTGCGACAGVCPVSAISFNEAAPETTEFTQ